MQYYILVLLFQFVVFLGAHNTASAQTIVAQSIDTLRVKQGVADQVVQLTFEKSIAPPSQRKSSALITNDLVGTPIYERDIQSFLHSFDKWANFTHASKAYKTNPPKNAGSTGMVLVQNKAGDIVCIPYPNSPAAKAGIREGDILKGIYSLAEASKVFSGAVGKPLTITIDNGTFTQPYTIVREKFQSPHVDLIQHDGFARIRIWYFLRNTPQILAQKLRQAGTQPVVIDVRANSGGSILAARNCAAEFLPKGALLGISQTRENKNTTTPKNKYIHTSKDGQFKQLRALMIWQDELTASAAEAFIVALVDDGRAISIGTTTFGKAFAQSNFTVQGNVLSLSTEALLRLNGQSWDEWGLRAQEKLHKATLEDYINATHKNLF